MVSGGGGWWISVRAQSRYADVCVQTCRLGATINEQNIGQRTQQWSGCVFDGQQPQQLSLEVCWPLVNYKYVYASYRFTWMFLKDIILVL